MFPSSGRKQSYVVNLTQSSLGQQCSSALQQVQCMLVAAPRYSYKVLQNEDLKVASKHQLRDTRAILFVRFYCNAKQLQTISMVPSLHLPFKDGEYCVVVYIDTRGHSGQRPTRKPDKSTLILQKTGTLDFFQPLDYIHDQQHRQSY